MLFNSVTGMGRVNGHTVKELVWDVIANPSLPWWLELVGTATLEFLDVSVSKGVARITIPSDDQPVVLRTAFDIKTDQFSELGFYVYSLTNQVSQQTQNIRWGDETIGAAMYRHSTTTPEHYARVFPFGADRQLDYVWSLNDGNYATRPKNLGITVRPQDKEVYFTQGDHMDGDVPVWETQGEWQDGVMRPSMQLITSNTQTQQRSIAFSKIKLRLAHW